MNKAIALADEGTEIGITGACAGKTKGRIYVEGFSEPHLMQAVSGIRMLMIYTMTIVPINDMTSIMEVKSKKKPVKRGQWVRCTRGHFKGDLARVEEVLEDGMKCIVKAVPRLDLTLHQLSGEQVSPVVT
jgi:transcription elongation factor SPT5